MSRECHLYIHKVSTERRRAIVGDVSLASFILREPPFEIGNTGASPYASLASGKHPRRLEIGGLAHHAFDGRLKEGQRPARSLLMEIRIQLTRWIWKPKYGIYGGLLSEPRTRSVGITWIILLLLMRGLIFLKVICKPLHVGSASRICSLDPGRRETWGLMESG